MRSDEFLNYIKSKGNREEYECALHCVKRIVNFENEYHVNIDEIIEDNDKADTFLRMSGYSEPLFFAMNMYMRAIAESPDLTVLDEKECTCPDRFIFIGTRDELIGVLSQMVAPDEAKKLAYNLTSYKGIIDETECVEKFNVRYLRDPGTSLSEMWEDWDVIINLKALSLVMIALLLDVKLKIGIASASLVIFGINGQAIVKISAENAEKCLIREAILRETHIIDGKIFEGTSKECVHNNYNCKYKIDGMCTITEAQIIDILDDLSQKNVFTKVRSFYKYNF